MASELRSKQSLFPVHLLKGVFPSQLSLGTAQPAKGKSPSQRHLDPRADRTLMWAHGSQFHMHASDLLHALAKVSSPLQVSASTSEKWAVQCASPKETCAGPVRWCGEYTQHSERLRVSALLHEQIWSSQCIRLVILENQTKSYLKAGPCHSLMNLGAQQDTWHTTPGLPNICGTISRILSRTITWKSLLLTADLSPYAPLLSPGHSHSTDCGTVKVPCKSEGCWHQPPEWAPIGSISSTQSQGEWGPLVSPVVRLNSGPKS